MSSNIRIQRICQQCNNEFTAKTTVTKYCSLKCSQKAYKFRARKKKIDQSDKETTQIKHKPYKDLNNKEFLSVQEASQLLGCSKHTIYRSIKAGNLPSLNLNIKKTIIKRNDIDNLFLLKTPEQPEQVDKRTYNIEDCYYINEVLEKYKIGEQTLQSLIKRNDIQKIKKGKFVYVPKDEIDSLLK